MLGGTSQRSTVSASGEVIKFMQMNAATKRRLDMHTLQMNAAIENSKQIVIAKEACLCCGLQSGHEEEALQPINKIYMQRPTHLDIMSHLSKGRRLFLVNAVKIAQGCFCFIIGMMFLNGRVRVTFNVRRNQQTLSDGAAIAAGTAILALGSTVCIMAWLLRKG
jgi:hypothetical protein